MITGMPRVAIAVESFDKAMSKFQNELGMHVVDFSPETVPSLGAHVGMCQPQGGSNIELMAPSNPSEPLSQALQKFLDRRGEGIYAVMLEAPDPNAEAEELLNRGVKVLPLMRGAGGRDIHPSSTHGVLIRVYPDGSVAQPDLPESAPPHYSGIQKVLVATNDASLAAEVYGSRLGLQADIPVIDNDRGVLSSTIRPPTGGLIELLSPVDTSREFGLTLEAFLDAKGEGVYGLALDSSDEPKAYELDLFGTKFLINH